MRAVIPVPEQQAALRRIQALAAKGLSPYMISADLRARGTPHVVWLDERATKAAFAHEGINGLSTSAGHRFRVISIFRRA